jgi:hypothetical protein
LAIQENKERETKKGQKEACTGKKGLKNIIELKYKLNNFL